MKIYLKVTRQVQEVVGVGELGIYLSCQVSNCVFVGHIADHQGCSPVPLYFFGLDLEQIDAGDTLAHGLTFHDGGPGLGVGGAVNWVLDGVVVVEIRGACKAFLMVAFVVKSRPDGNIVDILDLIMVLHIVPSTIYPFFLNSGQD